MCRPIQYFSQVNYKHAKKRTHTQTCKKNTHLQVNNMVQIFERLEYNLESQIYSITKSGKRGYT